MKLALMQMAKIIHHLRKRGYIKKHIDDDTYAELLNIDLDD